MGEIFIILFFIILLFYCFNKILSSNEYFDNQNTDNRLNIYFLNKNELSNMLIKDEDNYYKTFFNYDLYARNIKNIDEYEKKINELDLTIEHLNQFICHNCEHTFVEDVIDITPDRSQNITYCTICEYTKEE